MIYLKEAILHYYQATSLSPSYSEVPLEIESEFIHSYIEKHIERARKDFSQSEGEFFPSSVAWEKCQNFQKGEISFLEIAKFMAESLFQELVYAGDDISRDVLICHYFDAKNEPYLAYLICKNKAGYTHHFSEEEGKSKIILTSHNAILPSESQRLEAYALINLISGKLTLCDKMIKIDGDKVNLLADLVLGCTTVPSSKENYRFVKKTITDICDEYAQNGIEVMKRTKEFLEKESREQEKISVTDIAAHAFPTSMAMQVRFKHFSEEAALPERLSFEHEHIEKVTLSQKMVTDTGISVDIPLTLLDEEDKVSFESNTDGTINIILKGITKIEHK